MSTDALSDVLSAVRLTGSVFFNVTAKSPWVAEAPPGARIANEVTPGAQLTIEYHVVTRGSCWISLIGGATFEPVKLQEGDIAVIPHGDPHVISSAPGMRAEPNLDMHRRPDDSNALPFAPNRWRGHQRQPCNLRVFQLRCAPVQPATRLHCRASCECGVTLHERLKACSTNSYASRPLRRAISAPGAKVCLTGFPN